MVDPCTLAFSTMLSEARRTFRGKGLRRGKTTSDLLPEICVTEIKHTSNDQHYSPTHSTKTTTSIASSSSSSNITPRVHLISCRDLLPETSRIPNSFSFPPLHDDVLNALQDDFSVRVSNRNRRRSHTSLTLETQLSKSPHQLSIAKADVCVYLFTNATLHDANCFHDLCSAIALKTPVIFVRRFGSELPKNFADCVRRNSYGCNSFAEYIDKYLVDSSGRESPKQNGQRRKTIRQNNRLAPLSVRCRPTSTSDLNVRGVDIRKGKRKPASEDDSDLLLNLLNSFQCAFLFDEVIRSSYLLKQCVYKTVGCRESMNSETCESVIGSTTHSSDSEVKRSTNGSHDVLMYSNDSDRFGDSKEQNRLQVPEAELIVATREWGRPKPVAIPAKINNDNLSKGGRFSYDVRLVSPLPVEEKETTYLIFQDKRSPDGVRKVNFPMEQDNLQESCDESDTADESDPRKSPIHITDIDLAREVNKSIDAPDSDL